MSVLIVHCFPRRVLEPLPIRPRSPQCTGCDVEVLVIELDLQNVRPCRTSNLETFNGLVEGIFWVLTAITVFTRNVKRGHLDHLMQFKKLPDCVSAAEPDDLLKHISTEEEALFVAVGDQLASIPLGQSGDRKRLRQACGLCLDSLPRALSRNEERCKR
jgi:hypothetical protein